MIRPLTALVLAAFLGALSTAGSTAQVSSGTTISAASKKSTSAQRQERGQIACTVSGCQRIPPNCHPETGYNALYLGRGPNASGEREMPIEVVMSAKRTDFDRRAHDPSQPDLAPQEGR